MTNSREHEHDATGSSWQPGRPVVPGVTRRHFLQATGLGAAAAAAVGVGGGTAAAGTSAGSAAAKPLAAGLTGTIADLKHVVILMQENRSFDHYFGTLSGVRGFADKQALTWQNGKTSSSSPTRPAPTSGTCCRTTSPTRPTATSTTAGAATTRRGTAGCGTSWVPAKTQETMGYFTRSEIPFQYALADAFTICDGYHQAIMGPTSPNRMYFWTGTSSGWTSNPSDYTVDFGSDAGTAEVTTYPELLQNAGVTWQVYANNQVGDSGSYPDYFLGDFGDNPLWFYQQYNTTNSRKGGKGTLATRGAVTPWKTAKGAPALSQTHAAYVLSSFISAVKDNTLPQVSWIVAPAGYCEHPSYTPDYGAHYVNTVLQALFANPERVEQHGTVRHLRRARRVLRPPAPALPGDQRHQRVHLGLADRSRHPGADAHLLAMDHGRLRGLQRLRPHVDAPVPGRLDRSAAGQCHLVAVVGDR